MAFIVDDCLFAGVAIFHYSFLSFSFVCSQCMDLRHHESHRFMEAAMTVLFPWSSYFLAESFELSGIVAILFSGITMAAYAFDNLSKVSSRSLSLSLTFSKCLFCLRQQFLESLCLLSVGGDEVEKESAGVFVADKINILKM